LVKSLSSLKVVATGATAFREKCDMDDGKPKLLEQVRQQIRVRNYSIRTETVYAEWVKRFIRFHRYRHPVEMGAVEIEAFLTHLAVARNVSASTQNQALAALLFLYK
jgi:hypothetical protein